MGAHAIQIQADFETQSSLQSEDFYQGPKTQLSRTSIDNILTQGWTTRVYGVF